MRLLWNVLVEQQDKLCSEVVRLDVFLRPCHDVSDACSPPRLDLPSQIDSKGDPGRSPSSYRPAHTVSVFAMSTRNDEMTVLAGKRP